MRFVASHGSRTGEGARLRGGRARPAREHLVHPVTEGLVEVETDPAHPGPRVFARSCLGRRCLDAHRRRVDLGVSDVHPGQSAHEGVGGGLVLDDGVVVQAVGREAGQLELALAAVSALRQQGFERLAWHVGRNDADTDL